MAKVPVASQVRRLEQNLKQQAEAAPATSRVEAVKSRVADLQATGAKTIEKGVERATQVAAIAKRRTKEAAADRGVQVAAASAVGGGVVVGAGGAATGFVAGGALGAAVGVLPALFTFGLSIPIGAVIGSGCGVVVGGAVGGTTGFAGAGAAGYGAYTKRAEIKRAVATARAKLLEAANGVQSRAKLYGGKAKRRTVDVYMRVSRQVIDDANKIRNTTRELAYSILGTAISAGKKTKAKTIQVVTNKEVQATAASAAGGAVVLGTPAAATGAVAGGVIGGAVGVIPAIFTFGLSIPFCAVVGGGCGLVAGTTLGGTTGAATGAGGYQVYKRRAAIRKYLGEVSEKALEAAKKAQDKTLEVAKDARTKTLQVAKDARTRLPGAASPTNN